jgi:hypothetical protein
VQQCVSQVGADVDASDGDEADVGILQVALDDSADLTQDRVRYLVGAV